MADTATSPKSQNPFTPQGPRSRQTRKNRRGTAEGLTAVDPLSRPLRDAPTPFPYLEIHQKNLRHHPDSWHEEEADHLVGKDGFISDFVLATRGYQASTLFAIWSALYTVSAMVKRFAWMPWGEDQLFANLFVMFVAPAGICKKSTLINYGDKVLTMMVEEMEHPVLRALREPNTIRGEITSEALHDIMKPHHPKIEDPDTGVPLKLNAGSNVNIAVSELTTLISRKKYNVGLIQKLTDLYDCADTNDRTTRSDGVIRIENVYTVLFGGTTPDQMRNTFPDDALGSGFMSRVIPVVQEKFARRLERPLLFENCPKRKDLSERLAWIADHAVGAYEFEAVAEEYLKTWYKSHMDRLQRGTEQYRNLYARMDIILRKVAMLIRICRYEFGRVITLEDVLLAKRLLDATYKASSHVTEEIHTTGHYGEMKRVVEILENHRGGISKLKLYRSVQRYIKGPQLTEILSDLNDNGMLKIEDPDTGEWLDRPRKNTTDVYYLVGKADDIRVTDRQLVEELIQEEMDSLETYGKLPSCPEPDTRDLDEAVRLAVKNQEERRKANDGPKELAKRRAEARRREREEADDD